jgi:hypothetical protein
MRRSLTIAIPPVIINLSRTKLLQAACSQSTKMLIGAFVIAACWIIYPSTPILLKTGWKDFLLKHKNFNYMRRIYLRSPSSRTTLRSIPCHINKKAHHWIGSSAKQISSTLHKRISWKPGVHKVSKNLEVTSKFPAPEWWHEASPTLRTHTAWVTCELHCYLVLSARCMLIRTLICKNNNTCGMYDTNVRRHRTNVYSYVVRSSAWRTICTVARLCLFHPHKVGRQRTQKNKWVATFNDISSTYAL